MVTSVNRPVLEPFTVNNPFSSSLVVPLEPKSSLRILSTHQPRVTVVSCDGNFLTCVLHKLFKGSLSIHFLTYLLKRKSFKRIMLDGISVTKFKFERVETPRVGGHRTRERERKDRYCEWESIV